MIMVTSLQCASESPRKLVNTHRRAPPPESPTQRVWAIAESAFVLQSSHVLLMLWEPHFGTQLLYDSHHWSMRVVYVVGFSNRVRIHGSHTQDKNQDHGDNLCSSMWFFPISSPSPFTHFELYVRHSLTFCNFLLCRYSLLRL